MDLTTLHGPIRDAQASGGASTRACVRQDAVVSHLSAARLSGWALPLHLERDLRVHVTTEVDVVRRPDFVGHGQRGLVVDRVSGVNVAGRDEALRLEIMAYGLPEPVVAHPVPIGGRTFHPDLSYPDLRIAIEYDGDHHRVDDWQWDADIHREELFREAGWKYLRITKSSDMSEKLARLDRTYVARGGRAS